MARINTGVMTSLYDTGPGSSLSVPDPIFLFTLGSFVVILIFLKGNQSFSRLLNTTFHIHSVQIKILTETLKLGSLLSLSLFSFMVGDRYKQSESIC